MLIDVLTIRRSKTGPNRDVYGRLLRHVYINGADMVEIPDVSGRLP
ncbi:MAG: hypothetical protein ACLFQX_02800 [Candidatus Kapaibacterium sp.]